MKHFLQFLLLFWGVAAGHRAAGQVIRLQGPATEQSADNPKETYCGTPDITKEYLNIHPDVRERLEAIAAQTQQYIADAEALGLKDTGPQKPLITIPVVVHVIFNTAAENLVPAVIQSQIDELNLAFRGALKPGPNASPTLSQVPAPYAARVGDARVQFCLATRDPNGRATNGITYRDNTDSAQYHFFSGNAAMHRATGGTDAWNTAHYLNIWCYDLGTGIGVFPGTATDPSEDGVQMGYAFFGRGPHTVYPTSTLGRLTVHEVGHWLNLQHIFGDVNRPANCYDSDDVSDTPNQNTFSGGNPRFPKPNCSNDPGGEMFMNHMDLVEDDSKLMFTRLQALRMQASFAPTTPTRRGGYRESLRSSPGLCPTLGITSQSGWLPTVVQAGDRTDYGFRVNPLTVGCGGGTVQFQWSATGGWAVTQPTQFYPHVVPTGTSASVITLTGTYTNAQGFSFPLNPVQYTVNYIQPGPVLAPDPDLSPPAPTPVFTSAAAKRCPNFDYVATVAPVAGASGYRWTVPAGFTYQGQAAAASILTTAPTLTIAPAAALAGGIYLLQCQTLLPNRSPSALAAVPLTVNGGPRYEIVDSDAFQRTDSGVVCQRNNIFLELVPVGPTVPGAVNAFPNTGSITWNSIPASPRLIASTNTNFRFRYSTADAPDITFVVRATYTNPCDSLGDIITDSYTATTAPAGTVTLSNGYSCGTYPWRQYPPVLPPSAPYPNPAADRLHLPGYQGAVVVYNHQGQPMHSLSAPGTETGAALDTSAWPEGLYVVTGRNLLGEWQRHNVQIQH